MTTATTTCTKTIVNPDGKPNAQFWRFSTYYVPSFFDVVTLNHDFGSHWKLDTKTYAYGYSNHQHYQNNTDNDLVTDPAVGITTTIEEKVGGTDQPGWDKSAQLQPASTS